ncbi:brat [Cordylochernes scorpioides]|uniref:Brat n=1 Tax=Cordylochernes scorpioides TaxID=51811 RepID=A0ABY6LEM5_9ARAC|nr:brat [Cordylochernes scorpioides]
MVLIPIGRVSSDIQAGCLQSIGRILRCTGRVSSIYRTYPAMYRPGVFNLSDVSCDVQAGCLQSIERIGLSPVMYRAGVFNLSDVSCDVQAGCLQSIGRILRCTSRVSLSAIRTNVINTGRSRAVGLDLGQQLNAPVDGGRPSHVGRSRRLARLLETVKQDKLVHCPRHKTEALKFFCKTCNIPICKECTLLEHPKNIHDYEFLLDSATKHLENMKFSN